MHTSKSMHYWNNYNELNVSKTYQLIICIRTFLQIQSHICSGFYITYPNITNMIQWWIAYNMCKHACMDVCICVCVYMCVCLCVWVLYRLMYKHTFSTILLSSGRQLTILSSLMSLQWHSYSSSSIVEYSAWPGGQGITVKLKYFTCCG